MLRGLGDSKWPTCALATVISQFISGVCVVFRIYSGNYGVKLTRKDLRIDVDVLKMILRLSIPISLDRLVTSIGTMLIQAFANSFGDTLVAANSIVQKVDQFALLAVNSFGTALTMFAGQNMGAGEEKRCNDGIKKISGLIIGLCVLITVICLLGARYICQAFVNDEAVIVMGTEAIRLAALCYVFHALQVSLGGVLQGASATKPIMYISFIGIAARVAMCNFFAVCTGHWQGLIWAGNGFYIVVSMLYVIYLKKVTGSVLCRCVRKRPVQRKPKQNNKEPVGDIHEIHKEDDAGHKRIILSVNRRSTFSFKTDENLPAGVHMGGKFIGNFRRTA